jgi:hypothetical protein
MPLRRLANATKHKGYQTQHTGYIPTRSPSSILANIRRAIAYTRPDMCHITPPKTCEPSKSSKIRFLLPTSSTYRTTPHHTIPPHHNHNHSKKQYIRTSQSSLPVHIRLSLNPTHVTGPAWPVKVLSQRPVLASQTLTILSSAPETHLRVSAARAQMPSTCPKKALRHVPVEVSHRRTVESSAAVRMYRGGRGR